MTSETSANNVEHTSILKYVGAGPRSFGKTPFPITIRPVWEFFAVLEGRTGPYFRQDEQPKLESSHLWLRMPNSPHGWKGDSRSARVAVFHFDDVPMELEQVARPASGLEVSLTAREKTLVDEMALETLPSYCNQDPLLDLHARRVLMELSLLMLRKNRHFMQFSPDDSTLNRVQIAERWFKTHVSKQFSLKKIAGLMGTNEGTLRKLFREVRNCSPKQAMKRFQMERAAELLKDSDLKLDAIARESGFTSVNGFSTTFRRHYGVTPEHFRKQGAGQISHADSGGA